MRTPYVLLCACLATMLPPAFVSAAPPGDGEGDPVLRILREAPPPTFRPGHTLLPLAMWGKELSFEVRKELAQRWGFCLQFGRLRPELVARLDDPESVESKVCALAASDPAAYPLHVVIAPAFTIRSYVDELPEETWTHDEKGRRVEGKNIWSPLAPDAVFERIAEEEAKMLGKVLAKAPVAVLTNGGEYGMSNVAHDRQYWKQDPKILQAKGKVGWYEYSSRTKAHQEGIVSDAMRKLVPGRKLYIYYHTSPSPHRGRYSLWWLWTWDYKHMNPVSDLPNSSIYWKQDNSGFTGDNDMLTQALNAVIGAVAYDQPYSYNWVCAGWKDKDRPADADRDRYEGYLKCYYTAGMIGGVAGHFGTDEPENYIRQYMALGRVHGLFSWLEPFVRESRLEPGPDKHVWSLDLSAHELPTGDKTARVLARKHRQKEEWLITAWAADGDARDVTVEIPALGKVTLAATPNAAVYVAGLKDGQPVVEAFSPPAAATRPAK